jgi:hypothetical protein
MVSPLASTVEKPRDRQIWCGMKMAARNSTREKIRDVLKESQIPMDVENVRLRAGLKNWESTKAILLEMVLQGSILGQKTTKSWIFWVNTPVALVQQGKRRGAD